MDGDSCSFYLVADRHREKNGQKLLHLLKSYFIHCHIWCMARDYGWCIVAWSCGHNEGKNSTENRRGTAACVTETWI